MSAIATTPEPPYYAVIFSNELSDDTADYAATAEAMIELARQQPGFLGVESVRDGLGITVSYWRDLASISAWKENAQHSLARQRGRERWYAGFKTRIARVERDYGSITS
jgi:heme-degrading monooxygenase HmoA